MTTYRGEMGIQRGLLQENAVPEELCDGGNSFTFRGSHYTESDDIIYHESKCCFPCCRLLLSCSVVVPLLTMYCGLISNGTCEHQFAWIE